MNTIDKVALIKGDRRLSKREMMKKAGGTCYSSCYKFGWYGCIDHYKKGTVGRIGCLEDIHNGCAQYCQ